MADTITHILFGEKILKQTNEYIDKNSFILGNMGPDIFFYYRLFFPPARKNTLEIADTLHSDNPYYFISIAYSYAKKSEHSKKLTDYLKGYISHFYLDSFVHPFINSVSVDFPNGHKRFELAIDTLLLNRLKKESSVKYNFNKNLLVDDNLLYEISQMYKYSLNQIYEIDMDYKIFTKGYKHFLFTLRLLQDKMGLKQLVLKLVEKITNKHEYFRYLNYPRKIKSKFDYMNLKKNKWKNINTTKEEKKSFIEIFDLAYEEYMKSDILSKKSLDNPNLYNQNINFSGKPT